MLLRIQSHLDKGRVVRVYIPEAVAALKIQKFLECVFAFGEFLYSGVMNSIRVENRCRLTTGD